jgi:hypothetical protein
MQPTSLLDNLNSDLLAALTALLPKGSAQRVLVYVESHDDISFWRGILSPFEKKGVNFDIQLPSQNTLQKGKTAVLEFADRVGQNLVLCVDSDYDYLLQENSDTSVLINENQYIFQTYAYSIENLKCYSEGLHLICSQSSKNDAKIIDFNELMQLYSSIVYKLFLWSVHFSLKQDTTSFTLTEFCEIIKVLDKVQISDKLTSAFEGLNDRVNIKMRELERNHPNDLSEIELLATKLEQLGVLPTNTYLFIQGHTIKDNVVLMFLHPIFRHLKAEKENEIKANAKHNEELVNQLNLYKKQIVPIDLAIDNNTEFKTCHLYLKIESDISKYIEKFQETT